MASVLSPLHSDISWEYVCQRIRKTQGQKAFGIPGLVRSRLCPTLGPTLGHSGLRNLGRNLRTNNHNLPWLLQAFVLSCSAGTVTLGITMSMSFFLILGAREVEGKKNMFCSLLAWVCGKRSSSTGAAGQWGILLLSQCESQAECSLHSPDLLSWYKRTTFLWSSPFSTVPSEKQK